MASKRITAFLVDKTGKKKAVKFDDLRPFNWDLADPRSCIPEVMTIMQQVNFFPLMLTIRYSQAQYLRHDITGCVVYLTGLAPMLGSCRVQKRVVARC